MPDHNLTLRIDAEGGPLELDVRHFTVEAQMNRPYQIDVVALSSDAAIDLDTVIGLPATFTLRTRKWTGIVAEAAQPIAEEAGLSTYRIRIVPRLWLLTQRTNIRIFQHLSELEVVLRVLDSWEIPTTVRADRDAHRRREYRTQYEETDFDFVNRLMEEAGISYFFDSSAEQAGRLIIADAPHRAAPREPALTYQDAPIDSLGPGHATAIEHVRRLAPGKVALVDHDFRRPPEVPIVATAQGGKPAEQSLEMFDYRDGHFLYVAGDAGDPEDPGDRRGAARTDEREAQNLAGKRLRAFRARAKETQFSSNADDIDVGTIVKIDGHPRNELAAEGLLVTDVAISGSATGVLHTDNVGTSAADVYRPPLRTPRPVASGVESATVVGPDPNKSYKDRHGRVFVHFHWDRDEFADEYTTCWMHVSQPWGGANYGAGMMPRPGQEVIVSFFGSDPDRPVIVGRYHTTIQRPLFRYPSQDEEGGMISWSDDGSGGSNKVTWRDRAGGEMLHLRAQRDKTVQVNRNSGTNVGVDQSLAVGNDRTIEVGGNERRYVVGERSVAVGGTQTTNVQGDILRQSEAKITDRAATIHMIDAGQAAGVRAGAVQRYWVGGSQIVIGTEVIMIRAPQVLINPSTNDANAIFRTGRTNASLEAERLTRAEHASIERQQAVVDAMPPGPAQAVAMGQLLMRQARNEVSAARQPVFQARPLRPPPPPPPPEQEIVVTGSRGG